MIVFGDAYRVETSASYDVQNMLTYLKIVSIEWAQNGTFCTMSFVTYVTLQVTDDSVEMSRFVRMTSYVGFQVYICYTKFTMISD